MTSPDSTWMDIDDSYPRDLQSGVGHSVATETGLTNTASQSLEASMKFLESAMQSLMIQAPGQEQQQIWNPSTESLKNSITYAQEYAASNNPNRIEADTWLSEIDKLDDEMSVFIYEMGEGLVLSTEASDLVDQMLRTRQEVWNLVEQSLDLGQKFVIIREQIEDRKHGNVYLPGLAVSFEEDEELRGAIWDLKSLVEQHVDTLETTRQKQVELLTRGSMLQSQLDGF
ncbi:uncharacterized protein N7503_010623 [Penicillium pulvis]|uniref:uncharacterized protein n=1 Tax=Penicillium pulvis TaxID=1562058 RepID=UPI0025471059|nr:uncharacterized protein N7503_010623 [Penicillium pulvis]KAJ5785411.1 hypothetical protein N7503_010623 [Penicillium pulvis]